MNTKKDIPKINEPSLCPRCGKEFHCSPSGKCWCVEVFVAPDKLIEINDKYDSCLCPDCLKSFAK